MLQPITRGQRAASSEQRLSGAVPVLLLLPSATVGASPRLQLRGAEPQLTSAGMQGNKLWLSQATELFKVVIMHHLA